MSRLAYVCLVAGLLVGCSGSGPAALRGSPQAVVRAAANRTIAAGSAHVDLTIAADISGTGTVNLGSDQGSFTFGRTGAQAHLGDRFDVVTDGSSVWLRANGPAGGVPGATADRPWIDGTPRAVTAAARGRVDPLDTVLVRPGLGTDLAFLRGAVQVTPYGGEEVRGVSTYRYTLDVSLPVAIANSPPADRPALQAASDAIGPVLWPADVWLDTSGRVRRLQMAKNPFTHTTTTKPNLLITEDGNYLDLTNIQFYDFGTPADIAVPAADQAVEVPT